MPLTLSKEQLDAQLDLIKATTGLNPVSPFVISDYFLKVVQFLDERAKISEDFVTETNSSAFVQQTIAQIVSLTSNMDSLFLQTKSEREQAQLSLANAQLYGLGSQIALPAGSPVAGVEIYNVATAATYANFGGVVISAGDLNTGFVQLRKINGTWTKFLIPISGGSNLLISTISGSAFFSETGFYTTAGVLNASVNWRYSVREITINTAKFVYTLYGATGANAVSFFDAAGTYISGVAFTTSGVKSGEIAIPATAKKAIFSTLNVNVATSTVDYSAVFATANESAAFFNSEIGKKAISGYSAGQIPKTVKELEDAIGKVIFKTTAFPTNGFYTAAGVYNAASSFGSVTITMGAGKVITYNLFSTSAGSGARLVTFFDSSNAVISSVSATAASVYHAGTVTSPAGTVKAVFSILRAGGDSSYFQYIEELSVQLNVLSDLMDSKQDKTTANVLKVSKTLAADGVSVFNTISSALAAWKSGEQIQVFDGVYEENSLAIPDGAYVKGIGTVEIKGYLPVTATTAESDAKSTIDFPNSGTLENLIITAQNMRYPVHSDFGNPNATQHIINCRIIHLGNLEIYNYRLANSTASPNDAVSVWRAMSAWGCGSQAGSKIYLKNSYLESPCRAFSTHNNTNYNLTGGASLVQCDDCEIVSFGIDRDGSAMAFNSSVFVQSLSSKTQDSVIFNNSKISGFLVLQSSSADWREFTQEVKGGGNTSHLMQVRNFSGGSKLMTSQTTTQSAFIIKVKSNTADPITVTGNLAPAIFGKYISLKGSVGLTSYVKGQVNHAEAFAAVNAFGSAKTITFTSGADTKNLTLSAVYTTAAQLVADMNSQFGAGSFFAELYWPGFDWYPKFANEIDNFQNTGANAILRGRAVKKNGFRKIALMTSSDSASDFLGIAVQDIPIGASGDVKYSGYMLRIWADGLFGTVLADNDKIKVNADGSFSKSADGTGVIVSTCISNENISINI